jgi:hypothetical protein
MTSTASIQVKFLSDKSDIARLYAHLRERPGNVDIQRHGAEKDQTSLAFGIGDVASLVATFSDVATFLEIGKFIFDLLRTDQGKKIIIQTPVRRIEFVSTTTLSRAEIDEALDHLVKAAR